MKKRNFLSVFLTMILMASLVTGCGSSSSSPQAGGGTAAQGSGGDTDGKLKIGATVYYMTEFITLAAEGLKQEAQKQNVDLTILDANNDVSKQISQIENLISQKVDAIIVAAVDSDAVAPAVQKAKEAGIPLIGLNMLINSPDVTAYSGPNDVEAGELEMQYVADKLGGKGNIVILEGPIGTSAQLQRREGIHNVLEKNPGIQVLAEQTANWSRAEALSLMENWLQSFEGQIDAVVAQNDEMALGAIQALEAKGLKDEVIVVGVDAIKDACESIKAGKLDATVFQDAVTEAQQAVQLAVKAAKGEPFEKENLIKMELVTKENVDEYLKIYQ
ncbi:substrate-binding domain-containing protein [Brevibacillus marinus]|uniref:substrate-binding domain-containing protein n=1 Tax=Brevibacillus marinus TaxID=2496837 RepID=UPI000F826374|nr:substrate-binding domain-containing protein [Brevibacillus marinus]